MSGNRLLLALALVGTLVLLASPVSQAASTLFGYKLVWQPDQSLSLQAFDGHLLHQLKPGQHVTIHHGSSVLTLSLQRATPAPGAPWTPPPPPVPASPPVQQLLAAINRDRAAHKAPPLSLDTRLSQCSLQHSRHMASAGYISHDQFPADICTGRAPTGENVGMSDGDPAGAILWLHHSMMAEGPCPHAGCRGDDIAAHGHYLNLVNPAFHRIGIGIFTQNGITWLTEDFTG